MKLIVTKITPYKEKDGIVEGISEEGLVDFKVHGLLDPKSKNKSINNVLTIVDVTFAESNHIHKTLKESNVIFSPLKPDMSLEYLSSISLICEALNMMVSEDDKVYLYPILLILLPILKNGVDPYLISIKYLLDICDISGFAFEFNKCIRCNGKKNIAAFSFSEGGYICRDCLDGIESDLSVSQMLLIRQIKLAQDYVFNGIEFNKSDAITILNRLGIFIEEAFGVKLQSIKLIL